MTTLSSSLRDGTLTLRPEGRWDSSHMSDALEEMCANVTASLDGIQGVRVDLSKVTDLDTAGVWLLERTLESFRGRGIVPEMIQPHKAYETLVSYVRLGHPAASHALVPGRFFYDLALKVGLESVHIARLTLALINFLGEVVVKLLFLSVRPHQWRWTSFIAQLEQVGVNAIPIVATISFAMGIVFAYQGADQLKKFGADIYTINLVSISIAREVGILLAAIMVAGRSGSAITAQLGTMKINQELDALKAMGLDPVVVLAIPRLMALVVAMPLLAFVADMAGFIGGGVMVVSSMDVSPLLYVTRIGEAVTAWSFWIGIIKAPVFAFVIGVISCFEGFHVKNDAESVGKQTTKAVVESIFVVMLADALFSVFFSELGI